MNHSSKAREQVEALYKLYSDDVFRYAKLILHNHTEAMDVVQDVFFKAFCSWESFRNESNPKTWLLSITRNCAIDLLRKRKREKNFLESYEPPMTQKESMSVEMLLLEEALYKLKPNYRDVFLLRHIEDLSIQDAARLLGWSEGKVRTTDYRALQSLRTLVNTNAVEVEAKNDL